MMAAIGVAVTSEAVATGVAETAAAIGVAAVIGKCILR
jgi:hypothetical protein